MTLDNSKSTSSLWNPYESNKIVSLANMLGNQISKTFGWNVQYHLTDPDGFGIDTYLHEYTLKNVVDMQYVKVLVPDNKFPVETMIINQFNLGFFDAFEIHITKDDFKNAFGITKRPSEEDIIYICEVNMLYSVKHAQQFRSIMNSSIYYKVMLEKYEHKTNIRIAVDDSLNAIETLTDNTTLDALFGAENRLEEAKIANKEQLYPTSFDKIRQDISSKVTIVPEENFIDNFAIMQNYYDLSNSTIKNKVALTYTKIDNTLKKSDNRTFTFWFRFNNLHNVDLRPNKKTFEGYNIPRGTEFTFLNNYNTNGYKIYYKGDNLFFKLNDDVYKLNQKLLTNVWYIGLIQLDQRQKMLDMTIYRRNSEITTTMFHETTFDRQIVTLIPSGTTNETSYVSEDYEYLLSTGYKPVNNTEGRIGPDFNIFVPNKDFNIIKTTTINIEPTEYTNDENLKLYGSNIHLSNIRIFDDVIPQDSIKNILKQYIVKDGGNLILADNIYVKINYYSLILNEF